MRSSTINANNIDNIVEDAMKDFDSEWEALATSDFAKEVLADQKNLVLV